MDIANKIFSEQLRMLETPCSYIKGKALKSCCCPDNILLFTRTSGRVLNAEALASHYRYVLISVLKGEGVVVLDGKSYQLEAGASMLVFPFQTHHYNDVDEEVCWCFLSFEAFQHKWYLEPLRNVVVSQAAETHDCFSACLNAYHKDGAQSNLELVYYCGLLMSQLLDQVSAKEVSSEDKQSSDLALQIKDYVEAHMVEQLRVGDVAAHFKLSKSYFSSLFRKHFGKSLGAYMLSLRLARALEMLTTSELKIGEIGRECGFDSTFSFGRAFKREFNQTPREYRQICQEQ